MFFLMIDDLDVKIYEKSYNFNCILGCQLRRAYKTGHKVGVLQKHNDNLIFPETHEFDNNQKGLGEPWLEGGDGEKNGRRVYRVFLSLFYVSKYSASFKILKNTYFFRFFCGQEVVNSPPLTHTHYAHLRICKKVGVFFTSSVKVLTPFYFRRHVVLAGGPECMKPSGDLTSLVLQFKPLNLVLSSY